MAEKDLPLRIGKDIRDLWDAPKSEIHASVAALEATLGHKIVPIIQWPILWDELKDRFPDITMFIPSISRITVAWYERLLWRLDSDNYHEWAEKVLDLLSTGRKQLIIEPSLPPHDRPRTYWDVKTSSFYLGIPKVQFPPHSKVVAAFDQDFENLLKGIAAADEGWDDLAAEPTRRPTPTTASESRPVTTYTVSDNTFEARPTSDRLPSLAELSRPNDLFAQRGPYILTLTSGNPLIIRCSHEPSLELISAYFNRWGKLNPDDSLRRNVLKVELVESSFCSGVHDTLVVQPHIDFRLSSNYQNNPALVLAFIEGVLGYKLVHTDGHNWVYRSETILK